MIEFLYTGVYSTVSRNPEETNATTHKTEELSPFTLHAELYAAGDRFGIPSLHRLCLQKYEQELKSTTISMELLDSLYAVFEKTPDSDRSLRDIVIRHMRLHRKDVKGNGSIETCFKETALDIPSFTYELLESYISSPVQGRCYTCGYQSVEALQVRCLKCGKGGASLAG